MIPRLLEKHIISDLLKDKKTIIVLGARQVGKTTLVKAYEFKYQGSTLSKGAYSFSNAYQTKVNLVNKDNYLDFLAKT